MSDNNEDRTEKWKSRWRGLWKMPSKWWMIGVPVGGFLAFVAGIIFWGGFNTTLHMSNSLAFCTSCHEMDTVYEEYTETVHYQNTSGVRAICTDCHVPHDWFPMVKRKIVASRELWHKIIGTIDTPEKFEAHRLRMAERVWEGMRKSDSAECRNCHNFDAMKIEDQARSAQRKHTPEWKERTGDTCIDCHQGIAHKLPETY